MGEKSGGLWLIVIVVVLAGLLIAGLTIFFPSAVDSITSGFNNMIDESGFEIDDATSTPPGS